MTMNEPNGAQAMSEARRLLHDRWKSFAFQGGLMLVVGLLAILMPFAATFATVLFFGWLLVIAALFAIVGAFSGRGRKGFGSSLVLAVAMGLLGLAMLFDPFAGAVALTWLLALFLILSAAMSYAIWRELGEHGLRRWPLAFSMIVNVALAVFLVFGLPGTAAIAVGLFLGISFAVNGASLLGAALEARNP